MTSPGWDELLGPLAGTARENGTAALAEAATFLADALARAGWAVERVLYSAEPYRLRLAGVVILAGSVLFARWLRAGRARAALAVALALPVLLLAELDFFVPVFGWIGATPQAHVIGRLAPAGPPARRLVLVAHYDTKTDMLDHVERAPVELLGLPVALLMIGGALTAWRRPPARRVRRVVPAIALVYGVAAFTSFSAGALVRARSPGALDDGAACAVLVRLAETLARGPRPATTEVEVAFLSGEEIGVQGSWAYARSRFATPPAVPTWVVNLDPIGASPDLAVLRREAFTLRGFDPDPRLVALLDAVYREQRGVPLPRTRFGGGTDARSFLAHGVPAATLISEVAGHVFMRGLHSARDKRSRVDVAALEATLAYLRAVVQAVDGGRLG